jgi:hypothetical protein
MKLSEIIPTAPAFIGRAKKRKHSKSADKGGYCWELGVYAFSNPLDQVGKAIKKRRATAEKYGKKKTETLNSTTDYHRKHG